MSVTLQGTAYLDANQNGVQDSGEPGQANVTMYLDANQNGVLDAGEVSTVTNALGLYTFSNLTPSQLYTVREVAPAGSTPTGTPTASVQVGTNINLSPQAGSQTETAVAIDPTNTNNIFVVSNTTNGTGLFASSSHDGGVTWSAPRNIATGSDGLTAGCCDGSVAFDSYGNLFFTYIDSSISNIVVAMSADGGQTFTQLTRFVSPIDQPTITTGPNSVWVVYSHSGVPTVSRATVTGKGVNFVSAFSSPMGLSKPAGISGNFGDIAVGPDGQVAVAYQNATSNFGPDNIYLNVSTDGSTFGSYSLATSTNVGAFDRIPVQPTRSVDAEVSLGYDRSSGPHRGRLYMAYTDAPAPGSADTNIYLRYSDNNGASWSSPIKVNDDLTTNSQILPKLSVDPSTGNVAVSFYDARDSASNTSVAYYAAISLDGGQSFLLNKRLSAGMSTAPLDSFNFGDYSGMAFSGGKLWAAWGDNSNSTGENDGSLDVMVNSAWVSSFDGFEVRLAPGQTASNLNFGNDRTVSPQFRVDDFLYPFSITGPYWDRVADASAYRGFHHLHTQGLAQSASNTAQWSLPRPMGTYEIFIDWVASPTNAPNATYSIYDGPTFLTTVRVDQTARPSDVAYGGILWKSLGTYYTSHSNLIVVLSSEADGNLSADAAMVCAPLSASSPSKSMTASVTTSTASVLDTSSGLSSLSPIMSAALLSTDVTSGSFKTFPDKISVPTFEPSKMVSQPIVAPVLPALPSYGLNPRVVNSPAPAPVPPAFPTPSTPIVSVARGSLPTTALIPDDAWFLDTFFPRSSLHTFRPGRRHEWVLFRSAHHPAPEHRPR